MKQTNKKNKIQNKTKKKKKDESGRDEITEDDMNDS